MLEEPVSTNSSPRVKQVHHQSENLSASKDTFPNRDLPLTRLSYHSQPRRPVLSPYTTHIVRLQENLHFMLIRGLQPNINLNMLYTKVNEHDLSQHHLKKNSLLKIVVPLIRSPWVHDCSTRSVCACTFRQVVPFHFALRLFNPGDHRFQIDIEHVPFA